MFRRRLRPPVPRPDRPPGDAAVNRNRPSHANSWAAWRAVDTAHDVAVSRLVDAPAAVGERQPPASCRQRGQRVTPQTICQSRPPTTVTRSPQTALPTPAEVPAGTAWATP